MWAGARSVICFLLGVVLVLDGFMAESARGTEVIVGLLLMGVISLDQVRNFVANGTNGKHPHVVDGDNA